MGNAQELVRAVVCWPLVSVFTLSMAELTSAFPTACGLSSWSSKLGGSAWGWYTGWMNLIGQVAVAAGIEFGLATFVNILMNQWFGTPQAAGVVLLTYGIALAIATIALYIPSLIPVYLRWRIGARHWFTGPKTQGSGAQLAAIEAELCEDFDLAPALAA